MKWWRNLTTFVKLLLALAPVKAREKRFTKEDTCLETNLTLDEVNTCAKNETALNERSRAKMCNNYPKCQGEQLFYHCVRINNYTLVEACAPMHKIIGKHCPVFEKQLGRVVEDYNTHCFECPIGYDSNNSSIYSECVQLHFVVPVSQTSTSLKVIDPDTDKSFPPTKGTTVGLQQDGKLKTKSNNSYHISVNATQQPRHKKKSEHTWTIIGITSAIFLFVIGIIIIYKYIYLKRQKAKSVIPDESELQKLNESNSSPA